MLSYIVQLFNLISVDYPITEKDHNYLIHFIVDLYLDSVFQNLSSSLH